MGREEFLSPSFLQIGHEKTEYREIKHFRVGFAEFKNLQAEVAMKKFFPVLILVLLISSCGNHKLVDLVPQQNSRCNSINRGLMAQDGNDIWLTDIYQNPPVVKKYNIKTGEISEIFRANATYLTPSNQKIYYLNASENMELYMYDEKTKKHQKVYDTSLTNLTEYCGTIYFVENSSIMKLRSDDEPECIYQAGSNDNKVGNLWPTEEGIYFLEIDQSNFSQLFFLKTSNTNPELVLQDYNIFKFYQYNSDFILMCEEQLYLYSPAMNSYEQLLDFPVSSDSVCLFQDDLFCSSYQNAYILNLKNRNLITLMHTKFSTYVIGNLFCTYIDDGPMGFDMNGSNYKIMNEN